MTMFALLAALWIRPPVPIAAEDSTTAVFEHVFTNADEVVRAEWSTTALGVYEAYVNGEEVGGFLKPGFTQVDKCRHVFSYDVTKRLRCAKGAANTLSAAVNAAEITCRLRRHSRFPWRRVRCRTH